MNATHEYENKPFLLLLFVLISITRWLVSTYQAPFEKGKVIHPAVPQQRNGIDCGLYVLQFIESIARSVVQNGKPTLQAFEVMHSNWFFSFHHLAELDHYSRSYFPRYYEASVINFR